MDCKEVRNRLSDFEDGSLPETSENEIRSHLLACADCSAVERSLEAVRKGLRQLPPVPAPPELLERIHEAISRETLLAGTVARKSNTGANSRSTGSMWKFPFGTAAAILLFASIWWYMGGTVPGKATRQTELSALSSVTPTAETADLLHKLESAPATAAPNSAGDVSVIHRTAVLENKAPVQTAQAAPRTASEFSSSAKSATRANQSEERSIATLPEGMSDPKIRVYSLADLPAVPVLRASTRFARVRPYAPATTAEAEPAHHEAKTTSESEAHNRITHLRSPVPYGREISLEMASEEREETAERIARAAKRLGGTVEKVDRDVPPEGDLAIRVLLPERTAQAFIDDLWRNVKLPPEGMPQRNILPAGPKPGIIAYTVYLHAH